MSWRVTITEADAHRNGDCDRDCPVCKLEEDAEQ